MVKGVKKCSNRKRINAIYVMDFKLAKKMGRYLQLIFDSELLI